MFNKEAFDNSESYEDELLGGTGYSFGESGVYISWVTTMKEFEKFGYFTIRQFDRSGEPTVTKEELMADGMGMPGIPHVKEGIEIYDGNPTQVWRLPILRGFVVGDRNKVIFKDNDTKEETHFGKYTSNDWIKDNYGFTRETHARQNHFQVRMIIPGLGMEKPLTLTGKGMTKWRSWTNPKNFHDDRFGPGVREQLLFVAAENSIRFNHLFVDMSGDTDMLNNQVVPKWISARDAKYQGKWQPFTAAWELSKEEDDNLPKKRIATKKWQKVMDEYMEEVIVPWRAEWPETEGEIDLRRRNKEEDAPAENGKEIPQQDTEDDEIPF